MSGRYLYTEDLMSLGRRPPSNLPVDHRLAAVRTPLILPMWQQKLARHPDKEYVGYVLEGIEHGFRIGVDEARVFKQNMLSSKDNPNVVEEYLEKEVEKGNILGPFLPETAPRVHINRFGVIPKKHQENKWRLITDLSHPDGHCVNEAIDRQLCSLSYITVDQVASRALSLGKGALLAKIDIKSAYRLIFQSTQQTESG